MKKYKLIKELPTFSIGDEFRITTKGNLACHDELVYTKKQLKKNPSILKDWFEEIPEAPKTVWDLKEGDEYYYIDIHNFIKKAIWCGRRIDVDPRIIGNTFLTCLEAEKELNRGKAKQILLLDTKGFKPD